MNIDLQFARDTIQFLEQRPKGNEFIPGRYPFTYAYDYVRDHWREFGLSEMPSRAETSQLLEGPDKDVVCVELADANLREWHIEKL